VGGSFHCSDPARQSALTQAYARKVGGNEPSDVIECLGVVIQGRRLVESGYEPGQEALL